MLFDYLPLTLRLLMGSILWAQQPMHTNTNSPLRFQLRHEHGLTESSRVVFSDISPQQSLAQDVYELNTRRLSVHRPSSFSDFSASRFGVLRTDLWDETDVQAPNVRDRETLLMLAKMTSNAYTQPGAKDWYDLGPDWNNSYPFGWEPEADGFRGHIFATEDNSTVVISIKGTSAGWLVGGGGPTVKRDKLNDNLLFSCCCARVGPTWSTVCPCYEGGYKCDQGCLEKSLVDESLFYSIGTNLYNNVTYLYPEADIWLIGHSLGGSLASLLGITFGVPVIAFEAPGDRLAASRLHLPSPPSTHHVTHVYHTADSIAQGACTGVSSICAAGGYALETKCHLGKVIRYDTVTKFGWSVSASTHGIQYVIDNVLATDWDDGTGEGSNGIPKPVPDETDEADCVDCYSWEFGDYRNASLATSSRGCH